MYIGVMALEKTNTDHTLMTKECMCSIGPAVRRRLPGSFLAGRGNIELNTLIQSTVQRSR